MKLTSSSSILNKISTNLPQKEKKEVRDLLNGKSDISPSNWSKPFSTSIGKASSIEILNPRISSWLPTWPSNSSISVSPGKSEANRPSLSTYPQGGIEPLKCSLGSPPTPHPLMSGRLAALWHKCIWEGPSFLAHLRWTRSAKLCPFLALLEATGLKESNKLPKRVLGFLSTHK